MNLRKKLLLGLSIATLVLCGCAAEEVVTEEFEETEEIKEAVPLEIEVPEVEIIPYNINLLTGLADLTEEAIGMRPVAVMVSNVKDAMPQYGISEADIIFEIPVEGGLTRFMALYGDYTQVPDICSIRSCRDYFPAVSEGFDAFYIHWGMDSSILAHYNEMDLDSFNGMYDDGGIFDRDSSRSSSGYSLEHTSMMYGGDALVTAIEEAEMRVEISEDKTETAFLFNDVDEPVVPSTESCTSISIDFGSTTAGFTYDEAELVYYKTFNGTDQVDGVTGLQLSFTNVLVLEATIVSRNDSAGHVDVECYGVSDQVGYYISNGAIQEIRWSKADEYSDLIFYDLDGEELMINCGKSYIAFNYADEMIWE